MIESYKLEYDALKKYNVSRETLYDLEEYRNLILKKNKSFNLISKNTEKNCRERHIVDSAQIIEFIDKKEEIVTDIGTGSGLPGIVLAIIMKHKKNKMRFNLYEKSFRKTEFLDDVINKLKLNAEVFQKNIFNEKNLSTDLIVARAFKPLPIILDLSKSNFKKFSSIILFLGKNYNNNLLKGNNKWNFDYKEKKSITNFGSRIIKIYNVKKK